MTDPKTLEELKDEWEAADAANDAAFHAYLTARDAYYKALEAQENPDA